MQRVGHLHWWLEIPIVVSVEWRDFDKLMILKEKVNSVNFPITWEYLDESKRILDDLGIEENEEDEYEDQNMDEKLY